MKILTIPKNKITQQRKDIILNKCRKFCMINNIPNKNITLVIDYRVKNHYKTEGLFGGFVDMWNPKTKQLYVNLNVFREYTDYTNLDNSIHCILHELGHLKQILEKRMIIKNVNTLIWRNKEYKRAPFNYEIFSRIFNLDPKLAQDYHTSALPWEREAYELAEKFMKRPLYSYERVNDET